jgi:diadenosine tetraphosphate (Ap4A) HIT family hydrolase
MPSECFICRKQASGDAFGAGVIYEDDLVFSSHVVPTDGKADAYLGYTFVEAKRHVAGVGELSSDEAAAVGVLINDLGAALRSTEGAEHVYAHVYGDGVPHLHVHLQPRYPNTPVEYWPRRLDDGAIATSLTSWPSAPRGGLEAVRAISLRMSTFISGRRAER